MTNPLSYHKFLYHKNVNIGFKFLYEGKEKHFLFVDM